MVTRTQSPADALARKLRKITREEKQLELTDRAEDLLDLSSRAWIEELRLKYHRDESSMSNLAESIVRAAANDQNVQDQQQGAGHVDYFTWLAALGTAGRKILKDIVDKGF